MKQPWITNLRVLATLSVILLHAAANGVLAMGEISLNDWWICNIINTFGRFAVPVFVMLSGYLLLGKYNDLGSFLNKRLGRVAIPFLAWTIIYILWANWQGFPAEKTSWTDGTTFLKFLTGYGGNSFHLWFVYMLLGLYAITPVIGRWIQAAPISEIHYFLILWLVASIVYPYTKHLFGFQINYELRYFSDYVGYFVLGYYLGNSHWRVVSVAYILVFLLNWAIIAWVVYAFSYTTGKFDNFFTGYLSPVVILMSVSIFLFFKNSCNSNFFPKITNELNTSSYGMYLSHLLFLRILSREYQLNYTFIHPIIGIFLQFIGCTIMAYSLIWALRKIPQSNWITG